MFLELWLLFTLISLDLGLAWEDMWLTTMTSCSYSSLTEKSVTFSWMSVYSDNCHSAVKFMLDQIIDIPNLLYMGGDFNIRDAE